MAADEAPRLRVPFHASAVERHPLRTDRMLLRPLLVEDATDIWEYQRVPEVLRYIPWPERSEADARDHTARRSGMRVLEKADDGIILACLLRGEPSLTGAGDRVIGDVMLRVGSVENADLEIGWVLHPDFQGRGLAREAAAAAIALAFERIGAHRVHARLDSRNAASARLCERLGMRREATQIEDDFFKGEWTDTLIYAILRREWSLFDVGGTR